MSVSGACPRRVVSCVYLYTVDGDECAVHSEPVTLVALTPAAETTTTQHDNSSHAGSETAPSGSDYDDIGDVLQDEDGDEVTEASPHDSAYDGLQDSTRYVISQESSVYEQIQPDAAAAAAAGSSEVIGRRDKPRFYLQMIGDDDGAPGREELAKTFRHKYATISTEHAARASTL